MATAMGEEQPQDPTHQPDGPEDLVVGDRLAQAVVELAQGHQPGRGRPAAGEYGHRGADHDGYQPASRGQAPGSARPGPTHLPAPVMPVNAVADEVPVTVLDDMPTMDRTWSGSVKLTVTVTLSPSTVTCPACR